MRKLILVIEGLTLEEIKEVLVKVREIEQKHEGTVFVWVKGLKDLSKEEVIKIMKEIYPERPISG